MDEVPKLLALGADAHALAARCARSSHPRNAIQSVTFLSPILRPDKILGVGMNFHSFVAAAQGMGMPVPSDRVWFLRPRGCVVGPDDDVWLPLGADDLDYEVELAIVIGGRCRRIQAAEAPSVIAGY